MRLNDAMEPDHNAPSAAFERQVRQGCLRAERLASQLTGGDSDTALRQVRKTWNETELPSRCAQAWQTIWDAVKAAGPTSPVMTAAERRRYTALPDPVTLFRGCGPGGEHGWSWTVDRSIAIDFALRYGDEAASDYVPLLCTATVPKSAVLAYLLIGGEDEVIIDPHVLSPATLATEPLPRSR
ncbi:hypothetical protein [Austwickia chelonae]|uniref:hypothetical protein n=1 Tax=Austwickia chelonae TaxID=100225 RepID=UPI000E257564|nr:hypothetical protein [Austwickia chelonae]